MSASSTTSGVDTGSVSFGGLGSGTDFGAMIDQLREVEEYHINSLERWKTDWQGRIDAFDMITELMSELEVATSEISSIYDVIDLVGSTSNETAITASATSDAIPGTYTIEVQQLASPSIFSTKTSSPFVRNDEGDFEPILAEGSEAKFFEYTHGVGEDAVTVRVEVDDSMTIEDLVTRINNDAKNPGVKASLVGTGSGYVFQLQSTETGSVNALELNSNIPGMGYPSDNWNELEAKDAEFILNGFTDQVLTSYSNNVSEVIDGVTLNLKNITSGPTTVSITEDSSKVHEAVSSWVDSVNQLRSLIQTLTAVDTDAVAVDPNTVVSQDEADIGSILTGNYAVQLMTTRLNDVVTSAAFGFESQKDESGKFTEYSLMSELGISTNTEEGSANYGLLEIDETKLLAAIEENPMAVANLLAGSSVETDSENFIYSSATDTVQAGNYDVTYETDADGNLIEDSVRINGSIPLTDPDYPGRYTVGDATNQTYGLAIQFTPGAMEPNQSYTDKVQVKEGKALELNTFLQNEIRDVPDQPGNGAIPIVRSNYQDIINNLDKKIAEEEERLDLWETRMRVRYASLDAHLGVQSALLESNAAALAQANISGQ